MQKQKREWQWLERITQIVGPASSSEIVPLGDDAFVFENRPGFSVACQDMMIEGTHFDPRYTSAADLGHKSLASSLSDIAAMGASPHYIHVSLGLSQSITQSWLDEFYQSMSQTAAKYQCRIAGGDLCRSPGPLVVDVNVHGSCSNPLRIQTARPGDCLLASGPLGLSHVGLWTLQNNIQGFLKSKNRHLRPEPRLDLVADLQEKSHSVWGLTDCSDSLVEDASSFLNSSLGLLIDGDSWILDPEQIQMANQTETLALDSFLYGGENYELLLVVSAENQVLFPDWRFVGQFQKSPGLCLKYQGQVKQVSLDRTWSHF